MQSVVEYYDGGNVAVFNGQMFTRDKNTGYFLSTKKIGDCRKRLHVYVYETINGRIEDGCQIHHIDGDKSNNEPYNLAMLTEHDHQVLHGKDEAKKEIQRRNIAKAVLHAPEWHRSEEGRAWHSEHAKKSALKMQYKTFKCTYCGEEYQSKKTPNENGFCSNNCKSAYRRKMGFDNVERVCIECGETFTANKYSSRKRCECCYRTRSRGVRN